jgi:adenosylhomocysteine nucleosidase
MLGFICALDVEVEGIKELMENKTEQTAAKITYTKGDVFGQQAVCCQCGVGKVNAAMSAQIMIDLYHPDVIINSGIAGSLSKDIRIGDFVISDDCVQHDMDGTEMGDPPGQIWYNDERRIDIPADKATADRLEKACSIIPDTAVFRGRIASGDVFVAAHEKRQRIADMFGAISCEMEGGAVGQVCYRNEIPYAVLRCISDDFNMKETMDYWRFRNIAAEKSIQVITQFIKAY